MRIRPLLPALIGLLVLAAPPAAAAQAPYVPGEVIVQYRDGTSSVERSTVERTTGTETDQALDGGSEQLQIEDGESVRETVAELEDKRDVAYAVPNYIARASAFRPNDPGYRRQWNFRGRFGIRMPEAWTLARSLGAPGGRGAVVAVLDTGVAYRRWGRRIRRAPDLRHFRRGYDYVGRDRRPVDLYGHGTHVAGTIGQSTNNRRGAAGIAYRARIMPVRVLDADGFGDTVAIARGIRYAARRGADVINLSLEYDSRIRAAHVPNLLRAVRYARRRGAVVVAAAGNQGDPAVAYPARARGVIGVAATTHTGCEADYSNSGRSVDVSAPGGGQNAPNDDNRWDAAHCGGARGRFIYQQTFRCTPSDYRRFRWSCLRRFGLPGGYEGTSMAAPHVSAVAALVIATRRLGRNPSPTAVERHLERTARDFGPPGFDSRYGHGLIDAAAALRP